MANTIGFEGTIEGVQSMTNGVQFDIKTITRTGKVDIQTWIIPSGDMVLRACELWSGKTVKGGGPLAKRAELLKGKKVIFYIKD